jgi:hypothetical protein
VLSDCRLINLQRIGDVRGNLTIAEYDHHVPFEVKRIYYLTDVPASSERGGHAHKALHQFIIPISGSFSIHLDDGCERKSIELNDNTKGLYLCPMIWREINHFSANAICLVLASELYDEGDYYRDHALFSKDVLSK